MKCCDFGSSAGMSIHDYSESTNICRGRKGLHRHSHSYADHVSVLKFIERNWGLPPISGRSRDNLPNPTPEAGNAYVPLFSLPDSNKATKRGCRSTTVPPRSLLLCGLARPALPRVEFPSGDWRYRRQRWN
jgi:hypothetical protein